VIVGCRQRGRLLRRAPLLPAGAGGVLGGLLTHATIYWAGAGIDTSIRTYANNNRYPWTPSHDRWPVIEAPTGITFVGYEIPPA
jgi:hypothetical protein